MLEDLKKQFISLFENSWKYYFIELCIKGSPIFAYMVQEKAVIDNKDDKGDEDAKKWVHIPREELLSAYGEYYS